MYVCLQICICVYVSGKTFDLGNNNFRDEQFSLFTIDTYQKNDIQFKKMKIERASNLVEVTHHSCTNRDKAIEIH